MNIQGIPPTIMGYLTGKGAIPPQQLDQIKQRVDPQGTMDGTTRTMAAIASAKDPAEASAILQASRAHYNTLKAGAAAALSGTTQSPPNLNVSVQNANQAYDNVPDGNHIMFAPGQDGASVDVSVTPLGKQAQQFHLTVPQYNQFLHGVGGQYDNLMEQDVGQVLERLQQSAGKPVQQVQGQQPQGQQPQGGGMPPPSGAGGPGVPGYQAPAPQPGPIVQRGANTYRQMSNGTLQPQTFESAGGGQPQFRGPNPLPPDALAGYDQQDVNAANQMFTRGDAATQVRDKIGWLEGQKQQRQKNEIEMTRAKTPQGVATIKEQGYQNRTQSRENTEALKVQAQRDIAALNNSTKSALGRQQGVVGLMRSYVAAGSLDLSQPESQQLVTQLAAVGGMPPQKLIQAATQGAQQPAQGGGGNNPPVQGARQDPKTGIWYTRGPNGQAVQVAPQQ